MSAAPVSDADRLDTWEKWEAVSNAAQGARQP